jgi:hypothetical protein
MTANVIAMTRVLLEPIVMVLMLPTMADRCRAGIDLAVESVDDLGWRALAAVSLSMKTKSRDRRSGDAVGWCRRNLWWPCRWYPMGSGPGPGSGNGEGIPGGTSRCGVSGGVGVRAGPGLGLVGVGI